VKTWSVLKQKNILLVVLSAALLEGLYANLVFWIPYYYINIGEDKYSSIAVLGMSISGAVGGVFFETLFYIFNL